MGQLALLMASSGAGTASSGIAAPANAPGIVEFTTGSTTNGFALYKTLSTAILFGGGRVYFETRVRVPALSAAADIFNVYAGFGDNISTAGDATDGAYFIYSSSSNNYTNTTKWSGKTASNSNRTEVPSSTTVGAGTWYVLGVDVNAAGTLATFYVDGVSIGNTASNIPTAAGREFGLVFKIEKLGGSTGTTQSLLDFDYAVLIQRTTR